MMSQTGVYHSFHYRKIKMLIIKFIYTYLIFELFVIFVVMDKIEFNNMIFSLNFNSVEIHKFCSK